MALPNKSMVLHGQPIVLLKESMVLIQHGENKETAGRHGEQGDNARFHKGLSYEKYGFHNGRHIKEIWSWMV